MTRRFVTSRRGFLRRFLGSAALVGLATSTGAPARAQLFTPSGTPTTPASTTDPTSGMSRPSAAPATTTAAPYTPLQLLPILDGLPTPERARDVIDRLGRGSERVRVGFSGVFRYMMDVNPARDFEVVTTRLDEIVATARAADVPFLVHLNGGRWAGGGPLVERLMGDGRVMAWDHLDRPWSYPKDGEFHFSLGAYNELVRKYKRRNLQVAARWLASFAASPDGRLFAGVSTDSEVLINLHKWSDYNPLVIQEYVHWLGSEGVYAVGTGRWSGQGRDFNLRAVNERYGTSFARWKDVTPPREEGDSDYWRDWLRFRSLLVDHNVQEQVDWIVEAGILGERVFAHQSPSIGGDVHADVIQAAQVDGAGTGITTYGELAGDAALFERVRGFGAPWGIFEYNPRTDDEDACLAAIRASHVHGASIVCPYHWDDMGGDNEVGYTIRGTAFERALRRFVEQPAPA